MRLSGLVVLLLLFGMIVAFQFDTTPCVSRASGTCNPDRSTYSEKDLVFYAGINIRDIKPDQKLAIIDIDLWIENFPYNASTIWVFFSLDAFPTIQCNKSPGGPYFGWQTDIAWPLYGSGELFPFDSYLMRFMVGELWYFENTAKKLSADARSQLTFRKEMSMVWTNQLLESTWQVPRFPEIPKIVPGFSQFMYDFDIKIARRPLIPSLQFLVPIVLCYLFLGGSMLLPTQNLDTRLRVYLPLFVFSPTFFFAIQSYLPRRSSLSIPEFLLTYLIVCTSVFGFISMLRFRSISDLGKPAIHLLDRMEGSTAIILASVLFFSWIILFGMTDLYAALAVTATVILFLSGPIIIPVFKQKVLHQTLQR